MQLSDWVMNKIKKQRIIVLTWVTKMRSLSSLNVVQKVPFVFSRVFRVRGPTSTWEAGKEGGRETLNEEARVARRSSNIVL